MDLILLHIIYSLISNKIPVLFIYVKSINVCNKSCFYEKRKNKGMRKMPKYEVFRKHNNHDVSMFYIQCQTITLSSFRVSDFQFSRISFLLFGKNTIECIQIFFADRNFEIRRCFQKCTCTIIRRHTTVIEKVLPLPKVLFVILTKKLSYYNLTQNRMAKSTL